MECRHRRETRDAGWPSELGDRATVLAERNEVGFFVCRPDNTHLGYPPARSTSVCLDTVGAWGTPPRCGIWPCCPTGTNCLVARVSCSSVAGHRNGLGRRAGEHRLTASHLLQIPETKHESKTAWGAAIRAGRRRRSAAAVASHPLAEGLQGTRRLQHAGCPSVLSMARVAARAPRCFSSFLQKMGRCKLF